MGVLLFGVFSLGAAFAFNGPSLIIARAFQGIGGAMMLTTSAAIVTAVFPPWERGRALGLNMMAVTIGMTLGPPLGGLIVSHMGWPWIFLIKVPIAVVTVVAGWDLLGAERRDRAAATNAATGAREGPCSVAGRSARSTDRTRPHRPQRRGPVGYDVGGALRSFDLLASLGMGQLADHRSPMSGGRPRRGIRARGESDTRPDPRSGPLPPQPRFRGRQHRLPPLYGGVIRGDYLHRRLPGSDTRTIGPGRRASYS